jgi:uncharacterized hydrophobic protein (TIGR00271 family)
MPTLATEELERMRDSVFFDGRDVQRRLSRFWMLLVLAAIIAAAGVVADSTATVIGAMIVAPLMTPIQGTMLAVVLTDRRNLIRSIGLVVTGAAAAIVIGWLVGLLVVNDVVAETNSQVASRVHPHLVDLLAAVATGVVGSIALARRDIADTLPGVAIAISLVPPLVVIGLTFEAHAYDQAAGALLLFLTNVAAILAAGIVVMAIYRVTALPPENPGVRAVNRRHATAVVAALVVIVVVPLTVSSINVAHDTSREVSVRDASRSWARSVGWDVIQVDTRQGEVYVQFEGALPMPDTAGLRASLVANGVNPNVVRAVLVPRATIDLGTGGK